MTTALESVFGKYEHLAYPHKFRARVHIGVLAGGTPSNPDVAEAWIRSRGYKGEDKDRMIAAAVAEIMAERGIPEDLAIEEVAKNRHLTGFKRNGTGLYMEGRQMKACVKEAVSVAADVGKIKRLGYGENKRKGVISFMAEHVFIPEVVLQLEDERGNPITEPTDIEQSFVHTWRGSGIQYSEIVEDAEVEFTVETDKQFTDEEWAMLWLTAERQGYGAGRSQGKGRFTMIKWEPIVASSNGNGSKPAARRRTKAAA